LADLESETSSVELATELTIAWLSNPNTRVDASDIGSVLQQMHNAVISLNVSSNVEDEPQQVNYEPAVTVRKSLASKDFIISLIDGKPYRTLKRHLSRHGLTPDDYRTRFGLKSDYPMVAESYSQVRRDMARKIGLGRKAGTKVAAKTTATAPAKRARKTKDADGPAA
jgi:predicted transcriptional regulator